MFDFWSFLKLGMSENFASEVQRIQGPGVMVRMNPNRPPRVPPCIIPNPNLHLVKTIIGGLCEHTKAQIKIGTTTQKHSFMNRAAWVSWAMVHLCSPAVYLCFSVVFTESIQWMQTLVTHSKMHVPQWPYGIP